jgi:hypothetical protein
MTIVTKKVLIGVGVGVVGVAVIALTALIAYRMSPGPTSIGSVATIGEEAQAKNAAIAVLKEQLTASFKDPGSAQFQNTQFYETTVVLASGKRVLAGYKTLCGEVNGKNSLGGYVGFRPFISALIFSPKEETRSNSRYVGIRDPENETMQKTFEENKAIFCQNKTERIDAKGQP